ncbi:MAG: transposase [Candidatus Kapabacteria bacterium]|nr:transposase [Ignavibacteriota bacterium]MCW5885529.1 transposase [Candidatus Kapabacteria bacterium]
MKFYENTYYHLYNRTNNEEALFRSEENYIYFLKKYRYYLDEYFDTIAYCLMPTHFHFLVRVKCFKKMDITFEVESIYSRTISDKIGILLSSYTKAINKRYNRHGSLFQNHSHAKPVPSDPYLITLLTYIHQNPVRSKMVNKAEQWVFSSYQDYIDLRNGTLPSKDIILKMIKKNELKELTENRIFYKKDI